MPENAVKQQPELKIGPFAGGVAVNVWRNELETAQGPRSIRSITISPRWYRDKQSGEWKSTYSFRLADLAAIILALEKVREFITTNPLPGQFAEVDGADAIQNDAVGTSDETPF